MASKGQPKGDAKKKAKPTPFNSKNPLHIPELARLLKIAREKYQLKQSAELLDFVTCNGHVWAQRNKTEPGIVFQRKAPDGGLLTRILKTCKPEEKAPPPENPMSADRVRWEHIQRVYEQCGRNVSETSRRLRMHRRTLQRILSKHAPRN